MRKIPSLSVLLLAITFVIVNCTKEGPAGPAGPAGPQGNPGLTGPAGPAGPAGSANVIYSNWHTLVYSWRDSSIAGSNMKVNHDVATSVTASVISNGVVLAYFRISGTQTFPLPFTNAAASGLATWSYIPEVGKIFYTLYDHTNPAPPLATPNSGNQYRWIVIPGSVLGGRTRDPRTMTYQEVCQAYGIPE